MAGKRWSLSFGEEREVRMRRLCFARVLVCWIEVEVGVLHRCLLPSRHRSQCHHQLKDERLVEVVVVDCCSVPVDRSRIVRGSEDTRYRPVIRLLEKTATI